jgi:hypothetical protein
MLNLRRVWRVPVAPDSRRGTLSRRGGIRPPGSFLLPPRVAAVSPSTGLDNGPMEGR